MSTMAQNPSIPLPTPSTPARMAEIRFNDSVQPPLLPVFKGSEAENDQIPTPTQDAQSTQNKRAGQMSVATSKITWRSAKSRFNSLCSRSIGKQSWNGATWRQNLATTLNSGFGQGGLRSDGYRGPSEGRERGGYLPSVTGVGRIGKGPAAVPEAMIQALRQATGIEQRKRKAITRKMDEDHEMFMKTPAADIRNFSHETEEEKEARQQQLVLLDGIQLTQGIIQLCERAGSSEPEVVRHLKEIRERFDGVLLNIGVTLDQRMFPMLSPQEQREVKYTLVWDDKTLLKKIIEEVDFSERQSGIIISILTDAWVLRQKIPGARDGPFKSGPPPVWDEDAYRDWNHGEGGPIEHGLVVTPSQEELDLYLEQEEKQSIKLLSHRVLRLELWMARSKLEHLERLVDLREYRASNFVHYQVLLSAATIQPEARNGWFLFWVVTSKAWQSAPVLKALGHGSHLEDSYAERLQDLKNRWAQIVAKCPEVAFSHHGRDVEKMHERAMQHAGLSISPIYGNVMEVRQEEPHKGVECWFLEDVKTRRRKVIA